VGVCRIVSRSGEAFVDRVEAGRLLAAELGQWRGRHAVVLGIPRGGLVVGHELARALDADLDVVLARKLGAPGSPEFAIGAVAEDGRLFLRNADTYADADYIEREKTAQLHEIALRAARYRAIRRKVSLAGRPVILTDDGIATGATMQAAIWAARQESPQEIIVAVPVGPEDSLEMLSHEADWCICLRVPPLFAAVGQFYLAFEQVPEDEVLAILRVEAERAGHLAGPEP